MGYLLLGIENLTISLLLVALAFACVGRIRRRWLRRTLWAPVPLVLLLLYGVMTVFAAHIEFMTIPMGRWFRPAMTLTVMFAIGAIALAVLAMRASKDGLAPTAAAGWPRRRLTGLLALVVMLHAVTFWNLDRAIQQQTEVVRAEAQIMALSVAPPKVSDHDNAAILYDQAFKNFWTLLPPESEIDKTKVDPWGDPNSPQIDFADPYLRHCLKNYAATIALIQKAAGKPGCCFLGQRYDWPTIETAFFGHSDFRDATRLLILDARAKAADGDVHGAMRDIQTIFAMSRHLAMDPTMISQLVVSTLEQMAMQTLQELLKQQAVSADDLLLLKVDEAAPCQAQLKRSLGEEEALRLVMFCEMVDRMRGWGLLTPAIRAYGVIVLGGALNQHERLSREIREMADKPYYEAKPQWDAFGAKLCDPGVGVVARLLMPSLGITSCALAMQDARRQALRLGLAAEQYRLRTGRLPNAIDELKPDFTVPTDPCDGKPMKFKKTPHGVLFYSVGPDGVDDGGKPCEQGQLIGDIGFELFDRAP